MDPRPWATRRKGANPWGSLCFEKILCVFGGSEILRRAPLPSTGWVPHLHRTLNNHIVRACGCRTYIAIFARCCSSARCTDAASRPRDHTLPCVTIHCTALRCRGCVSRAHGMQEPCQVGIACMDAVPYVTLRCPMPASTQPRLPCKNRANESRVLLFGTPRNFCALLLFGTPPARIVPSRNSLHGCSATRVGMVLDLPTCMFWCEVCVEVVSSDSRQ